MSGDALKYSWLTYRRDHFWFPATLLAFFVLLVCILKLPQARFAITRAYLGFLVPLVAGMSAAYAVLDDPALELRFATPTSAARTLGSRLGLIFAVSGLCAIAFQGTAFLLRVDLSPLGGVIGVQLAWLVPTLALVTLGTAGSLASTHSSTGAFLAGAAWLLQLLMKGWFLTNGRYAYLFMGVLEPLHPDLLRSQAFLATLSSLLLVASWRMLERQERFL